MKQLGSEGLILGGGVCTRDGVGKGLSQHDSSSSLLLLALYSLQGLTHMPGCAAGRKVRVKG